MSYILNQFNQENIDPCPVTDASNMRYMEPITEGWEVATKDDNQCIKCTSSTLIANNNYYLHAKIKKTDSKRIFYIRLKVFTPLTPEDEEKIQYLKTVIVEKSDGSSSDWVDVEIVFKPLTDIFDCIVFELNGNINNNQNPVIWYEELDIVKNIINSSMSIPSGSQIIKMGIQAHKGLHTVINGESIHIGRSGLYEIKDDIITVYAFSIVSAAIDPSTTIPPITSTCSFNMAGRMRGINPFFVDYIYDDGEEA